MRPRWLTMRKRGRQARLLAAGLIALALLGAGCATVYEEVETVTPDRLVVRDPYKGMTEEELVSLWGKPSSVREDGEGGKILVYDERTVIRYYERSKVTTSIEAEMESPTYAPEEKSIISSEERIRFYLGKDGLEYRSWFHQKLWKDGIPKPPPPKMKKEEQEKQEEPEEEP